MKWISIRGLNVPIRQIMDSVPIRSSDAVESSVAVPRVTVRQCHELGSAVVYNFTFPGCFGTSCEYPGVLRTFFFVNPQTSHSRARLDQGVARRRAGEW